MSAIISYKDLELVLSKLFKNVPPSIALSCMGSSVYGGWA